MVRPWRRRTCVRRLDPVAELRFAWPVLALAARRQVRPLERACMSGIVGVTASFSMFGTEQTVWALLRKVSAGPTGEGMCMPCESPASAAGWRSATRRNSRRRPITKRSSGCTCIMSSGRPRATSRSSPCVAGDPSTCVAVHCRGLGPSSARASLTGRSASSLLHDSGRPEVVGDTASGASAAVCRCESAFLAALESLRHGVTTGEGAT